MSPVGEAPRETATSWKAVLGGIILPLVVLIAWWAVSSAGVVSPRRLPSPHAVVLAGIDLAQRGLLVEDVGISIQRVLVGFVAGSATGLLLGAGVGASRTARILFSPLIAAFRAVPTVAWFPVLLLYLGIGEAPKIALIAIGAAFPVFAALSRPSSDSPTERRLAPSRS